jgi:hypothetical protein
MSKIGQKIVKALQLDHKWVRVMLTVSALVVVVIFFIPKTVKIESMASREIASIDSLYSLELPVMDTTVVMPDSSTARMIIRRQPINIDRRQPAPPPPPRNGSDKSIDNDTTEPIQVQIVEAKKPFDWKGTITWGIGAMKGLILVFLNLKNLLFKKNT